MALSEEFLKSIAEYCKEDLAEPGKREELESFYHASVGYLEGAGITEPAADTARRGVWELVVKAMVLDLNDHRGMQVENTLQENPALRQMRNQLKLTT